MRASGRKARLRMRPPLWASRFGRHRFLPGLKVLSNYLGILKVKLNLAEHMARLIPFVSSFYQLIGGQAVNSRGHLRHSLQN